MHEAEGNKERPKIEPLLLDAQSVARLLGVSVRHVVRLADGGRMPRPRKVGRLLRWNRREIEQWVAAGCPKV